MAPMGIRRLRRAVVAHVARLEHLRKLPERLRSAGPLGFVDDVRMVPFLQLEQPRHLRSHARALLLGRREDVVAANAGEVAAQLEDLNGRRLLQRDAVRGQLVERRGLDRATAKDEIRIARRDDVTIPEPVAS